MRTPLLGFLWILTASASFACSCISPPPVGTRAEKNFAVFVGRVVSETVHDDERAYVFEASEVFKGDLPRTFIVTTHRDGATCGSSFSPEKTYLVFCAGTGPDDLSTHLCSGNRDIASKVGGEEIDQLRASKRE